MNTSNSPSKPPFRLALCSAGELFGGVERQLLGLCTYWMGLGIPPLLALFHDGELAAQAKEIGVEPRIISGRHRYDPGGAWNLAEVLAGAEINVVHAHGYKAVVNCALARRRYPFATVVTVHGGKEPSRMNPLDWFKIRVNRFLENRAVYHSQAKICYVTQDLKKARERCHRGLDRYVIHNGIEPLAPTSTSHPPEYSFDRFELAIVGRVTVVKGIVYALRAMASEEVPDRVRLNILGAGPQLQELQDEAENLGLGTKVRFLGFRRNIFDYIGHCDALLMPSLHEGLPYTLLEAMSLERPILASRVGGLAEILQNERTALLFEPKSVAGIRRALLAVLHDRELAGRIGQNAMHHQVAHFSLCSMGSAYQSIYGAAVRGERNLELES